MDLFADTNNTKERRFYSKFACPGSEGTDALQFSWDDAVPWICTPPGLIIRVVKKIAAAVRMSGVLVVPVWRTAMFWPFLCPDGTHLSAIFAGYKIVQPFLVQNDPVEAGTYSLMKGYTTFPFLALRIKKRESKIDCYETGNVKLEM